MRNGEYKCINGHWVKVRGREHGRDVVPDLLGRDCDGVRDVLRDVDVSPIGVFHDPRNTAADETVSSDPELEALLADDATHLASNEKTLSDQALALVNGPRAEEYAPPEVNMPRIGQMWAGMLGLEAPIPGWRVALMLAGLKLIRAAHKPGDDSLIDAVGYVEIAKRLRG